MSADPDVIIVGASARAAAQSALRAGLAPWCVDLFADRDLCAIAPVRACPPHSYPMGLIKIVAEAKLPPATPVLLTGAMENHHAAVAALQKLHPIQGPDAQGMATLRNVVRNQSASCALTNTAGIRWPQSAMASREHSSAVSPEKLSENSPHQWLIKPIKSAGGSGVRLASAEARVTPNQWLQQYIQGKSIGAVFRSRLATDGQSATCELLGVSEQIVGQSYFGVNGFRYAGSFGPLTLSIRQSQSLLALGQQLVNICPFTGLFGVDLILDDDGVLWPVEVNPRYTASVEVLEKACDFSALDYHSHPKLPSQHMKQDAKKIAGKAYVFAMRSGTSPDLYDFFEPDEIADVPAAGSELTKGQPICTLFAKATSHASCLAKLQQMAASLYTRLL